MPPEAAPVLEFAYRGAVACRLGWLNQAQHYPNLAPCNIDAQTLRVQPISSPLICRTFANRVATIHINPVKHGYAERAVDWPHSTIHRFIERGVVDGNWAATDGDG